MVRRESLYPTIRLYSRICFTVGSSVWAGSLWRPGMFLAGRGPGRVRSRSLKGRRKRGAFSADRTPAAGASPLPGKLTSVCLSCQAATVLQAAFRGHLARARLLSRAACVSEPPRVPSPPTQVPSGLPSDPSPLSLSPSLLTLHPPTSAGASPDREERKGTRAELSRAEPAGKGRARVRPGRGHLGCRSPEPHKGCRPVLGLCCC